MSKTVYVYIHTHINIYIYNLCFCFVLFLQVWSSILIHLSVIKSKLIEVIAKYCYLLFFRQRKNNLGHLLKMETVTDTHTHTEYIININCYFLVTVSIIWTHFGALLWKLSWQLSQFELCYLYVVLS